VLWSVVHLARDADVDAEEALREACARFSAAVVTLEREARLRGVQPSALGDEALKAPWAAATRTGGAQ
jgi:uncharacterized protein YabN with tetrapyrrole methylase and pyrophosphatase domain